MKSQKFLYKTMTDKMSGECTVYGWDVYPKSSVLAGQSRKNFLGSYQDQQEALEAHPDAKFSSPWLEPEVNLNHLPQ